LARHFFEAMSQSDALPSGAQNMQIHGGAFKNHAQPVNFCDAMNTMPKYVFPQR